MAKLSWTRIATGVLIVLIGVMLLLVTTDTVEADILWAWIPALFVLLGVWALVRSGFQNIVGPVMVIAIAGAFLLRTLEVIEAGVIGTYWPLFIVLFGVLVIINRTRRQRGVPGSDASSATLVGIFSSDQRRITADRFTSGEAVAIFGDAEIDLRETTVTDGPAAIDAVAIFGDIEVRVPPSWPVDLQVMTIFGEVNDRRRPPEQGGEDHPGLVITGTAIFADIIIRD